MPSKYVEQPERAARAERLIVVAREIAAAWGSEWTAREHENNEVRRDGGYMVLCHKSDSRVIVLTVRLYEPVAKIDVYGRYVTGPDYLKLSGLKGNVRPSISVSLDRPGAAIAKDIARRFLPDYTRVFTDICASVIAHQEVWDSKASASARLGALAGAVRIDSDEWRGCAVKGRVWFVGSNPQIDLKADNLTEAQAAQVIALVNSFKGVTT
jgi:hypothetical protein